MRDPHAIDLRSVYDASLHFMGVLSPEGILLDANRTALRAAGLSLAEVQGRPFWETPWWTHDMGEQARLRDGIRRAARGECFEMETTHPAADGRMLVVSFSIRPLLDAQGQVVALLPEGRDISDLAREREQLRLSEMRFRSLVEHAPEAIVILDANTGHFVEANAQAEVLFKAERSRLMALGPSELSPEFQPDGRASAEAAHAHICRALVEGTAEFEWTHRSLDGGLVPCEVRLLKLPGSAGDLVRGSMVDLRPRLAKERHLLESENKFRLLFERSVEGLLLLDGDRFTDCNQAVLNMMGCTEPEFLRLHPWELSPQVQPDGRTSEEKALDMIATAYAMGVHRFEWMHRRMSGEDFPVEVTLIPIPLGGKEILFTSWRDITDRKRAEQDRLQLERQMLHAQKLESLGVLAGGIAHDFNNLLTAILANLNLAEAGVPEDSPVAARLRATEGAALKAAELTRQLLAYSGKGRFVVRPHDLNLVVREVADLVKVSIAKKVSLHFSLQEDLPLVEADEAQLQQVILNLVTNASDAIGDREGEIRVSTCARVLDETFISGTFPGQGLAPGLYAVLEVGDTGVGMTPEVLSRIFDPFYTTKPAGHGLGLSAIQGIIRGHRAGLKVYSEPGRGTSFQVYLPATSTTLPQAVQVHSDPSDVVLGGRVLLVDDEDSILEVTAKTLERLGFDVETAADGREAIELFSQRPEAFRLALVDLTMPRMDGRECFKALRAIRPDLPVVLCSGFSEQESVKAFLGEGLAGFIQKPYSMGILRQALIEALRP
ncbi:MAG: PAS domain S-box protein [Geothrix sp.]|uniref:hybrid sensor histidine kinase/response regulator n=1 Tax=Geothrix sp. TaxID=1962974 RepID=UPI003BAECC75